MGEARTPQDVAFSDVDRATNTHEPKILSAPPSDCCEPHRPHGFQHHVETRIVGEFRLRREFEGRARTKAYIDKGVVMIVNVSAELSGVLVSWLQPDDRSIIILRPFGTHHCSTGWQSAEQLSK